MRLPVVVVVCDVGFVWWRSEGALIERSIATLSATLGFDCRADYKAN